MSQDCDAQSADEARSSVGDSEFAVACCSCALVLVLPPIAIGLLIWRRHCHPLRASPRNWLLYGMCIVGPILALPVTSFGVFLRLFETELEPHVICSIHYFSAVIGVFATPFSVMVSFVQVYYRYKLGFLRAQHMLSFADATGASDLEVNPVETEHRIRTLWKWTRNRFVLGFSLVCTAVFACLGWAFNVLHKSWSHGMGCAGALCWRRGEMVARCDICVSYFGLLAPQFIVALMICAWHVRKAYRRNFRDEVTQAIPPRRVWVLRNVMVLYGFCWPAVTLVLWPIARTFAQGPLGGLRRLGKTKDTFETAVLANPEGLAAFIEFEIQEFAVENVLFYQACEVHRDKEYLTLFEAEDIFKRFIRANATHQVNIPASMRDRYKREVLDARAKRLPKVPARILQPSRDEILHLMEVDAFPRYLVWSGKRKSAQKRASCRPDIVLLHMRGSSENPIVHSATDIWDDRDDSADRI